MPIREEFAPFVAQYKAWGLNIIPVLYKEKWPQEPDKKYKMKWSRWRANPANDLELERWFGDHDGANPTNIGVMTGSASKITPAASEIENDITHYLLVLEFDNQQVYDSFSHWWEQYFEKPITECTPVEKSGRENGGYHVWLACPVLYHNYEPPLALKYECPEVKSEGGKITCAPSTHETGGRYHFLNPEQKTIWRIENLDEVGIKQVERYEDPGKKMSGPKREFESRGDDFNTRAVEGLLEHCAFIKDCTENAQNLQEDNWWAMVHTFSAFGRPGENACHQYSQEHPKYSIKETDRKIAFSRKTIDQGKGPHRCLTIQSKFGFRCPGDCQANALQVGSPAGLAARLATYEVISKRTRAVEWIKNQRGKVSPIVSCPTLAREIMTDIPFVTMQETNEIMAYSDGIYQPLGEGYIRYQVNHRLIDLFNINRMRETVEFVRTSTNCGYRDFNNDDRVLNCENGIVKLDAATSALAAGETSFSPKWLEPHDPAYLFTRKIPVKYDPKATCPKILKFLNEIVEAKDVPLLVEIIAYCLEPGYPLTKAVMLLGDGANGKSKYLGLIRAFLSEDNCAAVSLHAMEYSPFAGAELFGKMANIFADLPSTPLKHVNTFKMMTGDDLIDAQKKYGQIFRFLNSAKAIFSANKPPKVEGEDTYAFWRRWVIVNFPFTFKEDDPNTDPNILDKITTPEELSGLLNLCLKALSVVRTRKKFSYTLTPEEVSAQYIRAADPIYAFLEDCCCFNRNSQITFEDLHSHYLEYATEKGIPHMPENVFGRSLKSCSLYTKVTDSRRKKDGVQLHTLHGIGKKAAEEEITEEDEQEIEQARFDIEDEEEFEEEY